jgi:hypothetical protein
VFVACNLQRQTADIAVTRADGSDRRQLTRQALSAGLGLPKSMAFRCPRARYGGDLNGLSLSKVRAFGSGFLIFSDSTNVKLHSFEKGQR